MNLILLEDDDFVERERRVVLRGRRFRHVVEVHRAAIGRELNVGHLGGRMGHGTVSRLAGNEIEMEVALYRDPPPALPITLVVALPRPKVLARLLSAVTAMGVKRIAFVNSWRVEKSYWKSPRLAPERLRDALLLGLEQGCDTVVPDISFERFLKPFCDERLPAIARGTLPIVAHPEARRACPRGINGSVTIAIGPEGGFIAEEIALFEAAGFEPVTLGERILTVEAAVPALLGRIS